jgi:photosystem II stability/assembly factor-like uncharacterized protein
MKRLRLIALGAFVLAVAGQSLLAGREQAAAAAREGSTRDADPLDALHFRSIGPASMSGRISDLAVYEANPAIYYVATAHGGVWKTTNNGTTFEAQLQDQGVMSIGDVTISQSNPDLVWVGTGESNNRQSTSWGDGVYKSTNGGKTYVNMGLRTSKHINRIVIDPRNNDIVFVAATGSLWGPGGERGVFKTADGGKTWKHVVKVDEDTGANDLVMDPSNSEVLYASTYQRRRTECCMNGGGPGSGLWKSTDGGETWTRIKGGVLDQPLGRIALDVYRKRPNILYALIEGPVAAGAGRGGRGGRGGGGEQGPGAGAAGAQEAQPQAAAQNAPQAAPPAAAPQQAGGGRQGRGVAPVISPDANGFYRSDDAGATWRKVNNANPRPMYFSKVRIDPNDPEVVYLGGVGLHQTLDGGQTMATDVAASTHDDVHAIWINPANSDHVLIGNDGGLAVSYDRAQKWMFLPNLPVGLFYHVSVDMATPYNICGGMQDNYNWCGPSAVRGAAGIAGFHWWTLLGGDGFVVLQDPTDYRIAYTESQDGNIVRVDRVTGETLGIRPVAGAGESPLRWHWDTPLAFSPHDPKVVFASANRVFRSNDRGLSWTPVSPDLSKGQNRDDIVTMGVKNSEIRIARNDGIVAWPAIVSFAESPKRAGVLFVGTDDGNLQVTRDGGKDWANVIDRVPGLPKGIFVSEVVPSRFEDSTVYATFDGHRQNDFATYIYASNDFGQTWRSIAANLKEEVARTLTEDQKNPDVLYLGTESGLFVTLDRGRSWQRLKANLPTVRIDEITLHPRDNAMILGTHGRAIWVLDNLSPIQELAAAKAATTEARLFSPAPAVMYRRPTRDRNYEFWGDQTFYGENPPQAAVLSWYAKQQLGAVALRITDAAGRQIREISGQALANSNKAGIQSACWDLRVQPVPAPAGAGRGGGDQGAGRQGGAGGAQTPQPSPFGAGCGGGGGFGGFGGGGGGTPGPFVLPGAYTVSLVVDGKVVDTKPLRVAVDPEVSLTEVERKRMFDMAMELHELQRRVGDINTMIAALNRQMPDVSKTIAGRADLPPDVKTSFEAVDNELIELTAKFAPPAGGRGFGGGGGGGGRGAVADNPVSRLAQAKNGLMGAMPATAQTTEAYKRSKTDVPKAIEEAQGFLSRAQALSGMLAQHNITLTVTAPAALKTADTR